MKHPMSGQFYLKEFTKDEMEHIKNCSICNREIQILKELCEAVSNLPIKLMPLKFKLKLMRSIQQPAYRLWQLVLVSLMVIISPVLLSRLAWIWAPYMSNNNQIMVYTYVILGILSALLLIPLTMQIQSAYSSRFEHYQEVLDYYLDKGINNILKH